MFQRRTIDWLIFAVCKFFGQNALPDMNIIISTATAH